MAWRLEEHVVRGEIDNRTRGRIIGEIWLAGVTAPLVFDLEGDGEPDVAGCFLRFENPRPIEMKSGPPHLQQRGSVALFTAARKVRAFDLSSEEVSIHLQAGTTPPEHLANALRLAWFSRSSGEVIIESASFQLEISEPAWRFMPEELQRRATDREGSRPDLEDEEEWDEFRCEQFLRESDARTERYGKLLEKFADHPDCERIVAREMGWTWLEDALDEKESADEISDEEIVHAVESLDEPLPEPDPAREGIDWVRDKNGEPVHPIQKDAHDALNVLLDDLKARGLFPDTEDEALGELIGHSMSLTAKLAGALSSIAHGWGEPDPGMTIAHLKRILEINHQALDALARVEERRLIDGERAAQQREALFRLRERILALIAALRGA